MCRSQGDHDPECQQRVEGEHAGTVDELRREAEDQRSTERCLASQEAPAPQVGTHNDQHPGEAGHDSRGPIVNPENTVTRHYRPVQQRRLVEIRLPVQRRDQEFSFREHLPGNLGVAGFLRLQKR